MEQIKQKLNMKLKTMTTMLMLFLAVVFVFLSSSSIANAQYWTDDPSTCPAIDEANYPGQNCDTEMICGELDSVAQCYDTSILTPPVGDETSNTNWSSSYNGGYIFDCYSTDSVADPYCDDNGTWFCDYNTTCYTTYHKDTTCVGGEIASSTCGDCRTGYQECDGSEDDADGCEVQTNVTNCATGDNNRLDATCTCICDANYYDCDASGVDVGNGCEVQDETQ